MVEKLLQKSIEEIKAENDKIMDEKLINAYNFANNSNKDNK